MATAVVETDASTTHSVSCSECQRRKQKCSRLWPCQHCSSRGVSHLCRFGPRKASPVDETSKGESQSSRKRKEIEHNASLAPLASVASVAKGPAEFSPADGLRALGYLQIDDDPKFSGFATQKKEPSISAGHEASLRAIPPRLYCDALVQNYFSETNYQYYAIYPPQFMDEYRRWWELRSKRDQLSISFTLLLLRVCACSAQSLQISLREKLEAELGETAQEMTDRFHEAAEKLSDDVQPGSGGVTHVQQLFVAAVWYKCESRFVDSWHALNRGIRYAQEIGMHDESITDGISEFDREMRRRVWCILVVWDRFQSLILSRPLILNESHCSVPLPEANLEYDPAYPMIPSPIMPMVLQKKLIHLVSNVWNSRTGLSNQEAADATTTVEKWFAELPSVFQLSPDISFDDKFPYLRYQRLQLHLIGNSAIQGALKPYLTKTNDLSELSTAGLDHTLLATAVDYALLTMNIAEQIVDIYHPFYTKNFVVAFTPFDTAALLCSAILRDPHGDLPRRQDVVTAIGKGLFLIKQLQPHTRVANIAYNVLTSLIPTLSLTYEEKVIIDPEHVIFPAGFVERPTKRLATYDSTSLGSGNTTASTTDSSPENLFPTPEANLPNMADNQLRDYDWQFDPNLLLGTQPLSDLDLGLLEPVWDWETITFPDAYYSKGLNSQV